MSYQVAIRRNADGVVRVAKLDHDWRDGEEYGWTEGNFGCDCNRHLFFERAAGNEPDDDHCGETAYTVLYVELPDGERFEIE